jgi:phosphate transport system permease protein
VLEGGIHDTPAGRREEEDDDRMTGYADTAATPRSSSRSDRPYRAATQPRRTEARRRGKRTRASSERLIELMLRINGYAAVIIIALIFVFLFKEGVQALFKIPLGDFIGTMVTDYRGNPKVVHLWQPVGDHPKYSLLPLLCGSFLVALPATLIAGVFGVACGIYLAELASNRMREILKPFVELLAGIPTVVIGFLCLAMMGTFFQNLLGTTFRLNAFVGAMGVALVIVPVITSLTEDALRAVPGELRVASYGLGATRWQTIARVTVPAAISGISAALILGMGRALGETMIVLMATGNAALITLDIFSSVRTMTATIAAELGAVAQGGAQYQALFLVGAILFTLTFSLNLIAELVIDRMRRRLRL